MNGKKNNDNTIQCLFDFKSFFKKKGHLYFPGTICFPQYFAYAISSTFQNLYVAHKEKDRDVRILCYSYFKILPIIVKQLFARRYKIEVSIEKLIEIVRDIRRDNISKIKQSDFILLENYLKDENSVMNYRKALLESALKYHKFNSVNELVNHLNEVKCCNAIEEKENDDDDKCFSEYPSSDHYLLDKQNNNINIDHINVFGTNFWGPFYWNVFHSIAETKCQKTNEEKELVDYIFVLPFTLPCSVCTTNYIDNVPYFEKCIDEYRESKNKCLKTLYGKIHDKVSYEIFTN